MNSFRRGSKVKLGNVNDILEQDSDCSDELREYTKDHKYETLLLMNYTTEGDSKLWRVASEEGYISPEGYYESELKLLPVGEWDE